MENSLIIKKRGDDKTRTISLRISESLLSDIDRIASETNRSRNDIINSMLRYGIETITIE